MNTVPIVCDFMGVSSHYSNQANEIAKGIICFQWHANKIVLCAKKTFLGFSIKGI